MERCTATANKEAFFQVLAKSAIGPDILEQIDATAMGTPSACMYATVYYAVHEIEVLLRKYREYIILYKRLIDDGLVIWNDRGPLATHLFVRIGP